ncbi:MAG TPA: FAD-binding oxidoreductase [Ktedonobacterales bacterium]
MGSVSYWQAEAAGGDAGDVPTRHHTALEGDARAEVAIVGGGITGTSTALWLAQAGVPVAVLEGRTIAAGASGRNGGFLLAGTAESYATAIARYGRERARRIWDFSTRNQRLAASLAEELAALGWATGFRRTGSLRIAATDAEYADLMASDTLQRGDGWDAELLPRDRLPARIQAHYSGAAYYPGDGEIQPARFVTGLARLSEGAGAAIYEASPVTAIEPDGEGVRITTAGGGTLRAGAALLATNAWLPELLAPLGAGAVALADAIAPTRGQMLVTAPVADRLFDCPCYADEGYQYWRQLDDGRLAVGGWRNTSFATENTSDETPGGAVQSSLDAFVHEMLGLAGLPIERRWAGIMAFSRDGLPYVGRLPGQLNVYVAGGYTGHGNASAILAARTIADLILGQPTPDADLFAPARIFAGKQAAQ